jgi:ferredoxin
LNKTEFHKLLHAKVTEVINEPEHNWTNNFSPFMSDDQGNPIVRVAMTNCTMGTDMWEGLRSPAKAGMHPLTPEDIWSHYACMNVETTRPDGSPNPLAMPSSYDDACRRFNRIVILCGMLVVNSEVYQRYAEKIEQGDEDPFDYYCRATADVSKIIDKAVGKAALAIMNPDRAVMPMTDRVTQMIADRTRSEYSTGRYHGPCNEHWPHNSVAVLTGLLHFGVNRLPFRDEVTMNGNSRRLFGRYRSIVVFDKENVVDDNSGGISLLNSGSLSRLRMVNDYSNATADIVNQRYCTYNATKADGQSVCGKCLAVCPSGALRNSTPAPDGIFDSQLSDQTHRMSDGTLDFDHANCARERHQKAQLYDDYVCARCETICAVSGVRKSVSGIQFINGDGVQKSV